MRSAGETSEMRTFGLGQFHQRVRFTVCEMQYADGYENQGFLEFQFDITDCVCPIYPVKLIYRSLPVRSGGWVIHSPESRSSLNNGTLPVQSFLTLETKALASIHPSLASSHAFLARIHSLKPTYWARTVGAYAGAAGLPPVLAL